MTTIIRFVFKGGQGSGNFGHNGRPGKVGGSGGTKTYSDMKITPDEYAAVRAYTWLASTTLNSELERGELRTSTPFGGGQSNAEIVANIDSVLSKAPPMQEDKTLYSFFDASDMLRNGALQEGAIVHRKGYTSTSDREGGWKKPTYNPDNPAVLMLDVGKGARNIAPISSLSQYPNESEWLVGRGMRYKITSIEEPHSREFTTDTNWTMYSSYVIHAQLIDYDV